jgi:hypothetical protein
MRALFVSVVACALALTGSDARSQCLCPSDVTVTPFDGAPAALNTHVRVVLPARWKRRGLGCKSEYADPPSPCPERDYRLSLHPAPGTGTTNADVTFTERDTVRSAYAEAELTPNAPLAPDTRYELWLEAPERARVLGTFVTGRITDTTSPVWSGVTSAGFSDQAADAAKAHPGRLQIHECDAGRELWFRFRAATDDVTPPNAVRYGIWIAAAGSSPDYQQPALAYLDPGYLQADATGLPSVTVSLGGGLCQDFDLGALDLVGRRKVGVRAVDVSGNASAPSEVTVDFRR